jgi:hypothetical protein
MDKGIGFFVYSIDYKVFANALRGIATACRKVFASSPALTKA